ncbi:MAG: hypothetical protein GY822_20645 [Deltaproteobacteria bacterium]|nr:hypothetical protein [Deltaproteobacteria bacterium]
MFTRRIPFLLFSLALLGAMSVSGCDDVSTFNCGRFDAPGWTAPENCVCINPDGEPTTFNNEGEEMPIFCTDNNLQACPSTSGSGCALFGQSQKQAEAGNPALVELHLDIGGHLHDLCCAQHFGRRMGAEYAGRCNGCIGSAGDLTACEAQNLVPLLYSSPESDQHACFVEWRYATAAPFDGDAYWQAAFDTSMRWTSPEVVRRGMGGATGPYTVPNGDGDDEDGIPYHTSPPLYGLSLSPAQNLLGLEQRAPDGHRLGSENLSRTPDEGGMGLLPEQVASF